MWDTVLILARLLQFAGALVLMGAALFCMYAMRPSAERRWPHSVLVASAVTALAGTILWVMAETALFSDDPGDGTDVAAVWLVFSETRFGRVCLVRIALLTVCIAASFPIVRAKPLWPVQVTLATIVVASFAWTGHGAATAGWPGMVHLVGDLVHLWSAAVWFGALVPIVMLIAHAKRTGSPSDVDAARYGLERFSLIGTWVVAAIVTSGLVNSWFLVGTTSWNALTATGYGVALLAKLGLLVLMLGLAGLNRFWLTPRLGRALHGEANALARPLAVLQVSVGAEIGLAVLVLVVVGILGTLAPLNAG